jgi:hypothetical protein
MFDTTLLVYVCIHLFRGAVKKLWCQLEHCQRGNKKLKYRKKPNKIRCGFGS